ncbi:MAG: TetR/AcrR family transcriptional regulator [Coriobacteriales bacterium]|jgi:AcrR family transcriptional regulator|nr:TetR/AcrR family transcriptional regulator [Coriobacteriales bacterium]
MAMTDGINGGKMAYILLRDARQRKTRDKLFKALLELSKEKPVAMMTVADIAGRAGTTRQVFYKYYKTAFELFMDMQEDFFVGLQQHLKDIPPNIFEITPMLLGFIDSHKDLIRVTFQNRGTGNLIDKTIDFMHNAYRKDWLQANPLMSAESVDMLFYYVTAGLTGIIYYWLFVSPNMSLEEVTAKAGYLLNLSTPNNMASS